MTSSIKNLDCCFIVAENSIKSYQKLSKEYSAIEPPTWALILAQSLRINNYSSTILDFDANRMNEDESVVLIEGFKPKLVVFVLYGQNPNAGTTMMIGASKLASSLKKNYSNINYYNIKKYLVTKF